MISDNPNELQFPAVKKAKPSQLRQMLLVTSPFLLSVVGLISYRAMTEGVDLNDFTWVMTLFGVVPFLTLAGGITAWELHQRDKKNTNELQLPAMTKAKPSQLRQMLMCASPLLLLTVGLITYRAMTEGVDLNDFTWVMTLFGLVPFLTLAAGVTAWELHQRDKKQAQSES